MQGFVIRTCAYYGDPVVVNGLPTRSSWSRDIPVTGDEAVNRPFEKEPDDFPLLRLVEDFEASYGCKIAYDHDPRMDDGVPVFLFDVFEPSCSNSEGAKALVEDLAWTVRDWVFDTHA